jgi:hypothetical protein
MQKVLTTSATIAGRRFTFARPEVERIARDLDPEPLRDHFVVIDGRRFPPKQIIQALTRLDRADFTTNQARAVLRRIGLATGRVGEQMRARTTAEATVPYRSSEADALRSHRGRWVAVKDGDVVVACDRPEDVFSWLRMANMRADSMFRVPLDPSADMGGFPDSGPLAS